MCCWWFQDFLGGTRKHYNAELESVDFQTSHEAARLNINTWVEKQTQGGSHTYTSMLMKLHDPCLWCNPNKEEKMSRLAKLHLALQCHQFERWGSRRGRQFKPVLLFLRTSDSQWTESICFQFDCPLVHRSVCLSVCPFHSCKYDSSRMLHGNFFKCGTNA